MGVFGGLHIKHTGSQQRPSNGLAPTSRRSASVTAMTVIILIEHEGGVSTWAHDHTPHETAQFRTVSEARQTMRGDPMEYTHKWWIVEVGAGGRIIPGLQA